MKRVMAVWVVVMFAAATLAGCNTIAGAGKDIKGAGDKIEGAARK